LAYTMISGTNLMITSSHLGDCPPTFLEVQYPGRDGTKKTLPPSRDFPFFSFRILLTRLLAPQQSRKVGAAPPMYWVGSELLPYGSTDPVRYVGTGRLSPPAPGLALRTFSSAPGYGRRTNSDLRRNAFPRALGCPIE